MTLTEFSDKWNGKNLPIEAAHGLGACVAMLEHTGLSKEEIQELVGDIVELARYSSEQLIAEMERMNLDDGDVH